MLISPVYGVMPPNCWASLLTIPAHSHLLKFQLLQHARVLFAIKPPCIWFLTKMASTQQNNMSSSFIPQLKSLLAIFLLKLSQPFLNRSPFCCHAQGLTRFLQGTWYFCLCSFVGTTFLTRLWPSLAAGIVSDLAFPGLASGGWALDKEMLN